MDSVIFGVPELQFLDEMEHIMARSKMSFRDSFFTWKLGHNVPMAMDMASPTPTPIQTPVISEEVDHPYAPVTPPAAIPESTHRIKFGSCSWAKVVEQTRCSKAKQG